MKKLFLTMLTILSSGAAFALPVGNPADASLLRDGICRDGHCSDFCDPCTTLCDAFSLRFGFYGDYIFNAKLEIDKSGWNRDLANSTITTNAAYFAGNFYDRFDIFFTLGATNFSLEGNSIIWGADGATTVATSQILAEPFKIESSSAFSYSVGLRGTLWECGCTTIGAEFQYFHTKPSIQYGWTTAANSVPQANNALDEQFVNPDSSINAVLREWQFGVGLSYRINFLVPYIAVKISSAHIDLGDAKNVLNLVSNNGDGALVTNTTLYDLKNQQYWGFATGVTLIGCEKASVTAEGRFGNETALYVNGQIRF